jgi:sterol carrier protein 2
VQKARKIHKKLTLLHCSPTSNGSACAIVASEAFVKKHGLEAQAVEIVAQVLVFCC